MGNYLSVPDFFHAVYLVDLSPSLLKIARARFARLGWSNVKVVNIDCRDFTLPQDEESKNSGRADLITMSYSLTMIPEFYPVIDSTVSLLAIDGIIAVVDFYAQSEVEFRSRDYAGGFLHRHCTWLNRTFWRAWFDLDRVMLDTGRRDYLEYRFGTRLSVNLRNAMLPGLRIPYYIWIGCSKDAPSMTLDVPFLQAEAVVKRSHLPLPSFWYQNHDWRAYYDDQLKIYQQFDESISALTWDDSRIDARILSVQPHDVILAPTSAGDNILSFALHKPKYIYAVDPNPTQNHLLELKIAAFQALDYEDIWKLFGKGKHAKFRTILMGKLSPYMSSYAFQFWLSYGPRIFAGPGLFGGLSRAANLAKRPLLLTGKSAAAKSLAEARTLDEQKDIWERSIRNVAMNRSMYSVVGSHKLWPWSMPKQQRAMIKENFDSRDGSSSEDDVLWEYAVNTVDPVARSILLSADNHYYLLCLLGEYTRRCHPDYLQPSSHTELSQPHIFDGLRIYTDEMSKIISRVSPGTLTIAVILDAMDRLDPESIEAGTQIRMLNKALAIGGRVLLKSVGQLPWYISQFEQLGFEPKSHGLRKLGTCIDA